jgi:hypothetical protein
MIEHMFAYLAAVLHLAMQTATTRAAAGGRGFQKKVNA